MKRLCVVALAASLLPLAGCRHKAPPPVASLALPPAIAPVMVSVPPPTHPTEPMPVPDKPVAVAPAPPPPPVKKPRRKKTVPTVAAPPPTAVAAATPPPIELGQLSTGGANGSSMRGETETMLQVQKQRLDRLPATVVAAHAADVEQARRFMKGAEDAWKTSDVEGAHTLVVKAKVLLDDLSK